jgi:phage baseplate assembly protein W
MARVEVAEGLLLPPGVPTRLYVSDIELTTPSSVDRVDVAEVALVAPPAVFAPSVSVTLRGRPRWQVRASDAVTGYVLPITVGSSWRVLTVTPLTARPVMTGRLGWSVQAAPALAGTAAVRVRSAPRWSARAAPPPIITIDRTLPVRAPLHLTWPLRLGRDGALTAVAQDSTAEVLQTAAVMLATTPGSRPAQPSFGFRDSTFDLHPPSAGEVEGAVTLWDDRVAGVDTSTDQDGDMTLVQVRVHEGGS